MPRGTRWYLYLRIYLDLRSDDECKVIYHCTGEREGARGRTGVFDGLTLQYGNK